MSLSRFTNNVLELLSIFGSDIRERGRGIFEGGILNRAEKLRGEQKKKRERIIHHNWDMESMNGKHNV